MPTDNLPGTLYVIATPIGNLSDMSPRAVETLKKVSLVLAEDTRSFGKLAKAFDIPTNAKSCFEHNEKKLIDGVIEKLLAGADIALTSEAGTPTISDPGYALVRRCREAGINVSPIPGPSALIAALSVSGLATDQFHFAGFLPQKPGKRATAINTALARDHSTIFYESPHRILKALTYIAEQAPEREVFIARELTKLYEECIRGTAKKVKTALEERDSVRGEFVLIVGKAS